MKISADLRHELNIIAEQQLKKLVAEYKEIMAWPEAEIKATVGERLLKSIREWMVVVE